MMHNKDRVHDENQKTFTVTHHLKGNTIADWERQFKENEKSRLRKRKDSVILNHEIISLHRDDTKHVTLDKLEEIAREYIRQRNPEGMYVCVPHFDKDHIHLHVCSSGVQYKTGKSMRLSKQDLNRLKKNIQQYQIERFPELSKSIVQHGKKEKALYSQKEYQMKLRTGRESNKDLISAILKTCYRKAISKQTFYELLNECGLKTYERGSKTNGIIYANQKYRFNKFGFTYERIQELDQSRNRKNEISRLRENKAEKSIEKDTENEIDGPGN